MEKTYGTRCAPHTKRFTAPAYAGIPPRPSEQTQTELPCDAEETAEHDLRGVRRTGSTADANLAA